MTIRIRTINSCVRTVGEWFLAQAGGAWKTTLAVDTTGQSDAVEKGETVSATEIGPDNHFQTAKATLRRTGVGRGRDKSFRRFNPC